MHTNEDVLERRQALVEANVLEGACKAGHDHVVRASRSSHADPLDEAVVPGGANDVQEQGAHKPEEGNGDRGDPLDKAKVSSDDHEEVDGQADERNRWKDQQDRLTPRTSRRRDQQFPIELDRALGWGIDARDDIEEGGLPCAVRPNDRADGTTRNLEVNVVHGHEAAELPGNATCPQHWTALRCAHFKPPFPIFRGANSRTRRRAGKIPCGRLSIMSTSTMP